MNQESTADEHTPRSNATKHVHRALLELRASWSGLAAGRGRMKML